MIASCQSSPLGKWLTKHGGHFHTALAFKPDSFGNSIYSTESITPQTAVVSCPFSLAITPELAKVALATFLKSATDISDHSAMILYLSLHRIVPESSEHAVALAHRVYVDSLPSIEEMRTPLYFNEEEMNFLAGTNLYGATKDREKAWREEWKALQVILDQGGVISGSTLTWDYFLFFSTILSSRAFPSSLIKPQNSADATPILFPGVDMLNHSYGRKVSWISENETFKIILDDGLPADEQVFNNYGPKPNEELLLGYGFTTPHNQADLAVLKLSLPPPPPEMFAQIAFTPRIPLPTILNQFDLSNLRHFIDRSGELPSALLAQLRLFLSSPEERESIETFVTGKEKVDWKEILEFVSWENELDVLSMLEEMLETKLELLNSVEEAGKLVRKDVEASITEYRSAQIEILESAVGWRNVKFDETIAKAREAGVDVDMEGLYDDQEEEEEEEE